MVHGDPALGGGLDQMEVPSNLCPYVFNKKESEDTGFVSGLSRYE